MRVFLTEHAEENLWQIYRYHADYNTLSLERFITKPSIFAV